MATRLVEALPIIRPMPDLPHSQSLQNNDKQGRQHCRNDKYAEDEAGPLNQSITFLPDDLFHRHCQPVRLSLCGRSLQLGRTSAPMMPQQVQTMRGPKDRMPFARMLASVIGEPR